MPSILQDYSRIRTEPRGILQEYQEVQRQASPAREALPTHLNIAGLDTPIPLHPKVSSALVGAGRGMLDTVDGVRQIIAKSAKLWGEEDSETLGELQANADAFRQLQQDPELGISATAGWFGGTIADPAMAFVPMGRAKSVGQMMKQGAKIGALSGGLAYVDEEAGQSRLGNIALGAAGGAAFGGAAGSVKSGLRKLRGQEPFPMRVPADADPAIKAGIVEAPIEKAPVTTQTRPASGIVDEFDRVMSKLRKGIDEQDAAVAETKRILKSTEFQPNKKPTEVAYDEAIDIMAENFDRELAGKKLKGVGESVYEGVQTRPQQYIDARTMEPAAPREGDVTLSFLGTGELGKTLQKAKQTYGEYLGEPLWNLVRKHPGTAIGGAGGFMYGAGTADEDASISEKMARGAAGALLLAGGVKGTSKLLSKSGIPEKVAKGFIDNYGLPDAYTGLRKMRTRHRSELLGQAIDIVQEATQLPANQRKILYNMMQGEQVVDADLAKLNDTARGKITEFGQMMVDLGLLSEETFKKNAATYLHRSYTSKLGGKQQFAPRILKIIGNELKPRGIMKTVRSDASGAWEAKGWETFGKPYKDSKSGVRLQRMRRQLSKSEREALGEIDDAGYALAETFRLMSHDIANAKFFDDIARTPHLASDTPVEGWVKIEAGKIPKTNVNTFGNLEGKYVPEEVFNDLKGLEKLRDRNEFAKAYNAMVRWWKLSKTALNPVVHTNNMLTNMVLLDLADTKHRYLGRALKELRSHGEVFKQARDLGVFDADFAVQELKGIRDAHLNELQKALDKPGRSPLTKLVQLAHGTKEWAINKPVNLYHREDNLFRLAVFMDRLKKGFSPEAAAEEGRKWFIDYDINADAVNFMRRYTHPFLAFTYRATPLVAEAATKRPWKIAKWMAVGYGLNALGEKIAGGDTEKERARFAERERGRWWGMPFGPPQMVKMPFRVDDTSQYLDVTRWIPGGDVFDTSTYGSFVEGVPQPLQPGGPIVSGVRMAGGIDPFTGERMKGLGKGKTPTARTINDILVISKRLAEEFIPNAPGVPGAYSTKKIMRAARGEKPVYGENVPTWQAIAQSFGFKLKPADLKKLTLRAKFELRDRVKGYEDDARVLYSELRSLRPKENPAHAERREEIIEELVKIKQEIADVKKSFIESRKLR